MTAWRINGEPGERIAVDDRGLAYGDGLFETVAVRGGAPRFLDAHLDRLLNGAARLGIAAPARAVFAIEAREMSQHCAWGTLKILLTRGSGPRGYAPPESATPTRMLGLFPGVPPAGREQAAGVAVRHCATPIGQYPAIAGLKTLGRLEQVLARAEWQDPTIAEGLMSTTDGAVVCGTMTNLFLVQDGGLIVPDLAVCGVRGIMRSIVLQSARRLDCRWQEQAVTRAALDTAAEVFLTNSQIGIWPVNRIDNRPYPVGPVTRELQAALAAAGVGECALR